MKEKMRNALIILGVGVAMWVLGLQGILSVIVIIYGAYLLFKATKKK